LEENVTTKLTIERAYLVLPFLVQAAQTRQVLNYKELSAKVGCHWRCLSYPLCYIRDEICQTKSLPPLTAIVVSSHTGLPSEGWLAKGTDHLTPAEYRRKCERLRGQVFDYQHWDNLLRELGLTNAAR
jgi:hypothetical protein